MLSRLAQHLETQPGAWAAAAGVLLGHSTAVGTDAMDLLATAAARHTAVHAALHSIAATSTDAGIRDHTQGILARVSGVVAPGEELNRWLADQASRAFDGTPMFPRPLTPLSKTWLGSVVMEDSLSGALRRAAYRFRGYVEGQGAANEELLTGVLLSELEVAFRDCKLRLAAANTALAGTISVDHRPMVQTEETQWGCDIALLLDADIHTAADLHLAELVQIKKSEATGAQDGAAKNESWRIDVRQLRNLLKQSQSSAYWPISSNGEIWSATAKWIHALGQGRDKLNQNSFTAGYNEIRHHTVPLDQLLLELFLGTWLGTSEEKTLRFARGEDARTRPRHIFQISVATGEGQR